MEEEGLSIGVAICDGCAIDKEERRGESPSILHKGECTERTYAMCAILYDLARPFLAPPPELLMFNQCDHLAGILMALCKPPAAAGNHQSIIGINNTKVKYHDDS